jgi:hypothetical protein
MSTGSRARRGNGLGVGVDCDTKFRVPVARKLQSGAVQTVLESSGPEWREQCQARPNWDLDFSDD